ncbi:hypothetical protein AAD018_005440 [Aestuariibius insulae]|uniref:hypothetical protein n=1 Tax=Aestuariibius insulae TaxID=2058287 RepID=UPI00345E8A7E
MRKSLNLALWAICLAALAVLGWLSLGRPAIQTRVQDLLSNGEIWRSIGLQIVLPIAANVLLITVITWLAFRGRDRKEQVIAGKKTLFLKPGAFWIGTISCLALVSLFLWVALTLPDKPIRWVGYAFAGLFSYIFIWLLRARVAYDDYAVSVIGWTLRRTEYRWSDLVRIDHITGSLEYHFIFDPGGRARVSQVFSDVDDLLTVALRQSNLMIPPELRSSA